jgi:hypothetical protein
MLRSSGVRLDDWETFRDRSLSQQSVECYEREFASIYSRSKHVHAKQSGVIHAILATQLVKANTGESWVVDCWKIIS